jgi:hypothetical protein
LSGSDQERLARTIEIRNEIQAKVSEFVTSLKNAPSRRAAERP